MVDKRITEVLSHLHKAIYCLYMRIYGFPDVRQKYPVKEGAEFLDEAKKIITELEEETNGEGDRE